MIFTKLPMYALAATLLGASPLALADEGLEEAFLFFELNDTDGDLGIHGKMDGDEWKKLEIEDPYERQILNVRVTGRLKRQGLTELFFESAEPTFDELAPADFFNRFPEGWYEIEAITLDGEELENEVYLSHVIPAAPAGVSINGKDAAEDCDAEELPAVSPMKGITISWDAVTESHMDLGRDTGTSLASLDVEVRYYQVVVEVDETDYVTTAIVPAGVTEWTFPEEFFDLSEEDEYKFEILVRVNNGQLDSEGEPIPGNLSAVESCFEIK